MSHRTLLALSALAFGCFPSALFAADVASSRGAATGQPLIPDAAQIPATVTGRVSVLDGRTLWFPVPAARVRLAGIDTCELPQWAFDPARHGNSTNLKPVPCGALAKAWLKRTIGAREVVCRPSSVGGDGELIARCFVDGHDLAIQMLRAGWARVVESPAPSGYLKWQRYAMSGRYGIWATYVLGMGEWRAKALDRSLARKPIADFNLLGERESEISPPFTEARRRPFRVDR
ncbi:thermonuclease family protein [Mesorhizobium sp. B1-1-8]|uniref:thermonuclease family protein n=1 Tax=Mesorhizobium sp. B1-1-8 TaxID=2589976 RepID=UPI00112D8A49|nr:thermonuclease family protein [Mesorhizobium sp. B1-1-8]UCI10730.1 thermonuclease family protein [Mesorhizobium sp. B1-1-8]